MSGIGVQLLMLVSKGASSELLSRFPGDVYDLGSLRKKAATVHPLEGPVPFQYMYRLRTTSLTQFGVLSMLKILHDVPWCSILEANSRKSPRHGVG